MINAAIIYVLNNYCLCKWIRVLIEKPTSKEIPRILWNPLFFTVLTRANHW
jgi:hypothetical protein